MFIKAIRYHKDALVIEQDIGDRLGEGIVLYNWGKELMLLDKPQEAIPLWTEALTIFTQIESPYVDTVRQALEALNNQ